MLISTISCDWKCLTEKSLDISICQNSPINNHPTIDIKDKDIIDRYLQNPITSSIVFGGLEPFNQFFELKLFISTFRQFSSDDIVIYTGYYENELKDKIRVLSCFDNIIIKFGRYDPSKPPMYDDVLGVNLASCNQAAKRIS